MTYDEALGYVIRGYGKGTKRGHEWVRRVLGLLGNPDQALRIIHVAGTNGKGSTCAMLSSILGAAGYRTGMFTSPHLQRFNERLAINGVAVPDADFARLAGMVKEAVDSLTGANGETLSFFETLTVMAYVYFSEQKVDYAIIEAGIGGRLDATNVIESPVLTVITAIGLDHTEILGATVGEIAAEKAGIIKPSAPVILHLTTDEAYIRIQQRCVEKNVKLFYFGENLVCSDIVCTLEKTVFSASSGYFEYKNLELGLAGEYQISNACHVLLAVEALRGTGASVSEADVRDGLRKAVWPGRMEIVWRKPVIILDGAHNPDGAAALAGSLSRAGRRVLLVVGVLEKKDARGMLEVFARCADMLWLTRPIYRRSITAAGLLAEAAGISGLPPGFIEERAFAREDFRLALAEAAARAREDDLICVAGSLYLVGDVRQYIEDGGFARDRF
ncbi:MAG: bifunctional folylpolyglutamate synthase/dihydrofolate synthase [Firmicutes bacterium]|nr:bifunctional folylpolyglutamate synthase/dihydrofolate synthase [Bacillota bacterium]